MLVDELLIPDRHGPIRVRLDERVTVFAGLGTASRARLAGLVVGALAGTGAAHARVRDAQGEPAVLGPGGARDAEGRPLPSPVPLVPASEADLHRLMVVRPADLGLGPGAPDPVLVAERTATAMAHRQLERELAAIEAAAGEADRLRAELEAPRRVLAAGVGVDVAPDGPRRLMARRHAALRARIAELPTAEDVRAARRRLRVTAGHLARLGSTSEPPTDRVRHALLGRAAALRPDGTTGTVPLVLDDPLVGLDPETRCHLLDVVVRVAERTQVLVLTGDDVVRTWARHRADRGRLRLVDLSGAAAP